jgi:hypothetical protein
MPTAGASASPAQQATNSFTASTWGKIGAAQIFDQLNGNVVTTSQAADDGPRYGAIWGARPGLAKTWRERNPSLRTSYYTIMETDGGTTQWGGIGKPLRWYEQHHPNWVLYSCTASGAPTRKPAYMVSGQVPLDFHNPEVIDYQVRQTWLPYAVRFGYNTLAVDEVFLQNYTGHIDGAGYYGCGIYEGGRFVRRYNGVNDSRYAADTVNWLRTTRDILNGEAHHLKLIINHPAGVATDSYEQQMLQYVDAIVDEVGFADYGNYSAGLFKRTVDWMTYAQQHHVATVIINQYRRNAALTRSQLAYSIASYLMGNQGAALLFTGAGFPYGGEQYHPEYETDVGAPCGSYYADPSNRAIFYRRFANAFVVVNAGSLPHSYEYARLPAGHTYRDLEGRAVQNPLPVNSQDGYVLMTSKGCR